jgi:hypothetical protein
VKEIMQILRTKLTRSLLAAIAHTLLRTVPFFRLGVSNGMVSQIIESGDDDESSGVVWVYGGVAFSAADPPYSYQLRISLAP